MTGALGKEREGALSGANLPQSEYPASVAKAKAEALESAVAEWIDSGPGGFKSLEAADPLKGARASFENYYGESYVDPLAFEVALNNNGFRPGPVWIRGRVYWVTLLPVRK